jgi:hypothetical protein
MTTHLLHECETTVLVVTVGLGVITGEVAVTVEMGVGEIQHSAGQGTPAEQLS